MIGVRKWVEEHYIDDAEERRVRADAERQRDDGDQAKPGFLHQHADAVMQVLSQFFEPSPSPNLARPLCDQTDVAEVPGRRALVCLGRGAAPHPVRLRHLEMVLDLFVEFLVPPLTAPKWESHA